MSEHVSVRAGICLAYYDPNDDPKKATDIVYLYIYSIQTFFPTTSPTPTNIVLRTLTNSLLQSNMSIISCSFSSKTSAQLSFTTS